MNIQLFECGSIVYIGDDIAATVLAASIRGTEVQYEVAWWDGRVRRTDWISSREVSQRERYVREVGFMTNTNAAIGSGP